MSRRSGMTLIEVLAALVLMSLVAGATLPLLRTSVSILREAEPAVDAIQLERLADSLLDNPEELGLVSTPTTGELVVPGFQGEAARVELLTANDGDTQRAWLAVSWGGRTVFRWLPEPPVEGPR